MLERMLLGKAAHMLVASQRPAQGLILLSI